MVWRERMASVADMTTNKQLIRLPISVAMGTTLALSLGACGDSTDDSTATPSPSSSSAPSSAQSSDGSSQAEKRSTSRQRAGKIVTDKYGGNVISIESNHENGQPTWEVEVENSSKGRIEVDVAKRDGSIVELETD